MPESYVALLRGINAGAKNRIRMPDLEALLDQIGYRDVSTYVQSGNAIFTPPAISEHVSLEADIERAIAIDLGLQVPVVVRSASEMRRIVAANPFAGDEPDPTKLHIAFLKHPCPEFSFTIPESADRFHVTEREIHFHHPNSVSGAKITSLWFERKLKTVLTARNWRTVCTLSERMSSTERLSSVETGNDTVQ